MPTPQNNSAELLEPEVSSSWLLSILASPPVTASINILLVVGIAALLISSSLFINVIIATGVCCLAGINFFTAWKQPVKTTEIELESDVQLTP